MVTAKVFRVAGGEAGEDAHAGARLVYSAARLQVEAPRKLGSMASMYSEFLTAAAI